MKTSEVTSLQGTAPAGLTGLDPMPYGERRWNGAVWPDIQVDAYNRLLADIARKHRAGMDTQNLIDGLYNMAHGFDVAGKPSPCDHDLTADELRGMTVSGDSAPCPRCGSEVIRW